MRAPRVQAAHAMFPLASFRLTASALLFVVATLSAVAKPRARELGVPFEGTPGPLNAITDVAGVEVGHVTLISGNGKLEVGRGPVRTGVTAILPRGKDPQAPPVFAGFYSLNGNGEMTGTAWIEESGFLAGPVLLTNTHSVGVVRDAIIAWKTRAIGGKLPDVFWSLPVVAETWDGWLNDINGFHVKPEHVFAALEGARGGPVSEGSVGGGTGMICYEFKGGIGTASRRLGPELGGYTVGALVQANHGVRNQLTIAGVPVGREIGGGTRRLAGLDPRDSAAASTGEFGSIIILVATDAPLLPHQLKRLARRAALGLARTGSVSGNGSGDLFLAFSTANTRAAAREEDPGEAAAKFRASAVDALPNESMNPLFASTVEAVEEAIVNVLVAGETMTGRDDHVVEALSIPRLQEILKKYNRLAPAAAAAPARKAAE